MFGHRGCKAVVLLGLAATAGCLGPRRSDYRSSHPVAVVARSDQADQLWETIQEVLRRHRFRLDRVDRNAGVVTTMYETSQHLFEFWRHDVDTREDLWESTLNPIRRRVEVHLVGPDENTWRQLSVAVYKQRLSSPDRQFNSTGAVYQYFTDTLPSTTGQLSVTAEDDVWIDLGRDRAMQGHLLREMLDSAGVPIEPDASGDATAVKTP